MHFLVATQLRLSRVYFKASLCQPKEFYAVVQKNTDGDAGGLLAQPQFGHGRRCVVSNAATPFHI